MDDVDNLVIVKDEEPISRWNPYQNYWKGKRVMITGHAGFLGSRLGYVLKQMGALCYGVDYRERIFLPYDVNFHKRRDNFEAVFMGDVRDYSELERLIAEWRPDYIFHLAAISQVVDALHAPLQTYEINVMGTANVLEIVRKSGLCIRVVVASSDKAYGRLPGSVTAHEGTVLDPYHPYDVSKAAADFVARSYADIYNMPVTITRCGNIYGPFDTNWQRIIPGAIRAALEDKPLDIRSDGTPIRVYNYVDDIIEAYLMVAVDLMLNPDRWGTSWTIAASDDYYSVLDIAAKISDVMGKDIAVNILSEAAHEEFALRLDPHKITKEFRWSPQTKIEDGIAETVEWMKEWMDDTRL